MSKLSLLKGISFGEPVAEEESDRLEKYFVETDSWRQLKNGKIDIVYGPKGSGKSALYWLLHSKMNDLFDRNIITIAAENPTGTAAFSSLETDPPTSEHEFVSLWKLYLLSLIGITLKEYSDKKGDAKAVIAKLEEANLLEKQFNLRRLLKICLDYVREITHPEALETEISIDPVTGSPNSFKGKIHFREPSREQYDDGIVSVDELLETADRALAIDEYKIWIMVDRLDVAFAHSKGLEENALRALFRVYADLRSLKNVVLKIFLRDDIWKRITETGFREASHITKTVTIKWDTASLQNLIVRRLVQNPTLCEYYNVREDEILRSSAGQNEIFYKVFPSQVESGQRRPATLDWMIGRTRDGTGQSAPREIIQLLKNTLLEQIRTFELGETESDGEELFSGTAIRNAFPAVSKARLELTLWAEYPQYKEYTRKLEGEKTLQNIDTLKAIWSVNKAEAKQLAEGLVGVGFFELRGSKEDPLYWVPFLYRSELGMVQGSAFD